MGPWQPADTRAQEQYAMSDGDEIDLPRRKALLIEQRDELLRQTADHADELKPVELDQARLGRLSRMDAMQSQAMSAELQRRRETDLRRINEALQRIEDGEYGYCVTCGEPINPKRLEIEPMTSQCVRCASDAEKQR